MTRIRLAWLALGLMLLAGACGIMSGAAGYCESSLPDSSANVPCPRRP